MFINFSPSNQILLEKLRLKQRNFIVDPLRETHIVHQLHELFLIVLSDVLADILQYWQDLVELSIDHLVLQHPQDGDGCLEQHEDAVEEVEVPYTGHDSEVEGPSEEGHEPLVEVDLWLDVLKLEVLTELGQVVGEDLLVELHNFAYKDVVEGVIYDSKPLKGDAKSIKDNYSKDIKFVTDIKNIPD